MRLSAKQIGDKHGLTSREVNQLLKRQGFLKGEPNNWCPTEKAEPYIHETDYKRGTGGYKQYNPSWTVTTYDKSILKELYFSQEEKQAAREADAEARRKKREEQNKPDLSKLIETIGEETDDSISVSKLIGGIIGASAAVAVIIQNNVLNRWYGKLYIISPKKL